MSRYEKLLPPPPTHEIVRDATTGLEWQAVPFAESMTWEQANKACKALRLGGHDDWRLPTRVELLSLVDDTRYDPAINTEFFPDCPSDWFWTSTDGARSPSECAWVVDFRLGHSLILLRFDCSRVRAVRGASRQ